MSAAPPRFFGQRRRARNAGAFLIEHSQATVPAEDIPDHIHDDAHFVFVTRGRYVSAARGGGEPLLIYNPAGTEHRDHFAEPGGWFLSIVFDGRWAEGAADARSPLRVHDERALAAVLDLLRTMDGQDGAADLQDRCLELLALTDGGPAEFDAPHGIKRALDVIHDDADPSLTVAGIAALAGVHPAHLCRAFRRRFGRTPSAMLQASRLERAVGLIANADIPLSEIALASGFFDQSHMTNAFRRGLHATPAGVRRRLAASCAD